MLDIKLLREEPDKVKEGIEKKGVDPKLVDTFLSLDEEWRGLTKELDDLRAAQKKLGKGEIEQAAILKKKIKDKEKQLKVNEGERDRIRYQIPNVPLKEVPAGGAENNVVLRKGGGEPPKFDFEPKDHLSLGKDGALDMIDLERAAKVSGNRFAYLKGDAVLLEFALIDFVMKTARAKGFIPIIPPALIPEGVTESLGYWARGGNENYYLVYDPRCRWCKHEIGFGVGVRKIQIRCLECADKGSLEGKPVEQEMTEDEKAICHKCKKENRSPYLFLIGTAEHSIAPIHTNEKLEEKELPKRYVGFSTAFRREIRKYGEDTRGIFRVHQFDKVELFSFCHPDRSYGELQFLVELEEDLWQQLGIPYRVVQLAAGDMSHPAASTIDIEAWLPGRNRYEEVSSASNTTDFQAEGFNTRFRRKGGKLEYVHMLNATGLAIGRTLVAIMENNQTKDGKIKVPKVLQEYVGKEVIG